MLFAWGANSHGQLGTNDQDDREHPVGIGLFSFSLMAGGGAYSLFADADALHTCGSSPTNPNESQLSPVFLTHLPGSIAEIKCGWDFSLLLTRDGRLWGFGSNAHKQLACDSVPSICEMELINVPRMKHIAAGLWHAVAITDYHELICWGSNSRNQLGKQKSSSGSCSPTPIPMRVVDSGQPIGCCAGAYHTAVSSDNGSVIVTGDLKYFQSTEAVERQIHQTDSKSLIFPSHLFGDRFIVKITSGWSHLVALTDDGCVYSWGRGDLGQLGRSVFHDSLGKSSIPLFDPTPHRVDLPTRVVDIACGSEHTLAMDAYGGLWSWGWNEHGMCGVTPNPEVADNTKDCVFRPQCVHLSQIHDEDDGWKVTRIGAGYGHSLALTSQVIK